MPLVHQAVASFVPYDAVSEAALRFRRILEDDEHFGTDSSSRFRAGKIVAEGIHRSLSSEAIHFGQLESSDPENVIVYHVSTDSEIASWLEERPEKVVLYYHNLTPSYFFAPYDPEVATRLEKARYQLARLSEVAVAAAAASRFSADELRRLGFAEVGEVPYPILPCGRHPLNARNLEPAVGTSKRPLELLFVGRITPNKAQHQLLRLAALLHKEGLVCNLRLVGGVHVPLYRRYLGQLSARLGFGERPFLGTVSNRQLAKEYENSTLFVSFSRHEGFFVPAVEAMQRGLPVVALMRGAVPETVGEGGVIVPEDDIAVFASIVLEMIESPHWYEQLSWAALERAARAFDIESVASAFFAFLDRASAG